MFNSKDAKAYDCFDKSQLLTFDPLLATQLKSFKLAIVVSYFKTKINEEANEGRNFFEGRTWIRRTAAKICSTLPFFSQDQMRRHIRELKELGLIIKKEAPDRSNWYAFEDEKMFSICPNKKNASSSQ